MTSHRFHGLGATEGNSQPLGRPQIPEVNVPPGTGTTPRPGPGAAPGPGATGAGAVNASPEEQDLYNRVVALYILALYDKKLMPKTNEMFEKIDDPVQGVAEVVSQIGMRVYSKAKEEGIDIPGDVLLHASEEMVDETVEFFEGEGMEAFTPEQTEAAFYATADKFSQAARSLGIYSDDQIQADKVELDRMADSGELTSILEQITAAQQGGAV